MFRIKISEQVADKLIYMDQRTSSMLIAWVQKHLVKCVNPREYGKSLFKKDNRFWQYRIGDIRVLGIIYDDNKLIVIANINYGETLRKK